MGVKKQNNDLGGLFCDPFFVVLLHSMGKLPRPESTRKFC